MKKITLLLIFSFLFICFPDVLFCQCNPIQITDNSYNDTDPEIHNGQITWHGADGDDEIYFWDGTFITQITDNSSIDIYPRIHNGQITWMGSDGDDEIYFWDGTSIFQITNNSQLNERHQIHNGQIVWRGFDGTDYEIYKCTYNSVPAMDTFGILITLLFFTVLLLYARRWCLN